MSNSPFPNCTLLSNATSPMAATFQNKNPQKEGTKKKPIANDPETHAKILDVITSQFDLEILTRYRELKAIQDELQRGNEILHDLRQLIIHGDANATAFHRSRTGQLSAPLPNTSSKDWRPSKPQNENSRLYGRRSDGVYVRLACHICQKTIFANQLGFYNHCRYAHKFVFGNYEEACKLAGTPVDESEVPLDHACRLRPVLNLATGTYGSTPGSGSNVPQERPTIKVYDEQVDIETVEPEPKNKLRNLKKFGTQRKRLRSPSLSSETRDSADEDVSGFKERAEGDAQDGEGGNMPTSGSAKENYSEVTRIEPQQRLTPELTSISNLLLPINSTEARIPSETTSASSTEHTPITTPSHKTQSHQLDADSSHTSSLKDLTTDPTVSEYGTPVAEEMIQSNVIPGPASAERVPQVEQNLDGSRFHVKRKILVGNVSKFVQPEKRNSNMAKHTHKWMVYVTCAPLDPPIETFIRCIRFFLHASYRPHDIVDVTDPPFRLTRYGWGEFPIRMQIHFVDLTRNKPVDVYHWLKLDHTQCGRQILGTERSVDLEVDRNSEMPDSISASTPAERKPKRSSTPSDLKKGGEEVGGDETRKNEDEVIDIICSKMSIMQKI